MRTQAERDEQTIQIATMVFGALALALIVLLVLLIGRALIGG